jgi:hypothetical protein
VLDALADAGAGRIGDYERCSFRVRGTGTFRPGPSADPYSGTVGEDAAEDEYRLEVELPRRRAGAVVAALVAAHPYEEVAYDLVPLVDGAEVGLRGPRHAADATAGSRTSRRRSAAGLPAPHLRYAGDPDREVTTVAVVGGAGDCAHRRCGGRRRGRLRDR